MSRDFLSSLGTIVSSLIVLFLLVSFHLSVLISMISLASLIRIMVLPFLISCCHSLPVFGFPDGALAKVAMHLM